MLVLSRNGTVTFNPLQFKGKVHPKNVTEKNAVHRLLVSHLVLKIFAFKVEKFMIRRPPSLYANQEISKILI